MKHIRILSCIAIIVLLTSQLSAQNNPVVSNVAFGIVGTTVTVTYDVADAQQSSVTVYMKVSSDGGATWMYDYGTATGAIGTNVTTGIGKTITWTYSGPQNNNFQIMISANDEVAGGDPCPGLATVDYSGKTYNTILIGDQCWLKENLDVGVMINSSGDQTNNATIEKFCYNNLADNCLTYGGLYQWEETMQYVTTPGTQGICPPGWHIPTYQEFQILYAAVGGGANGNLLKSVGQGTGSGAGTNKSGFSALFSGYFQPLDRSFYNLIDQVGFWSSTYDGSNAYLLHLSGTVSTLYLIGETTDWTQGRSVRCLKN